MFRITQIPPHTQRNVKHLRFAKPARG